MTASLFTREIEVSQPPKGRLQSEMWFPQPGRRLESPAVRHGEGCRFLFLEGTHFGETNETYSLEGAWGSANVPGP